MYCIVGYSYKYTRATYDWFCGQGSHIKLHLSDAFIQSDSQCIQAIQFYCQYVCSLGIEPTTFVLLTQCSNH